jgi:hypothetical protein
MPRYDDFEPTMPGPKPPSEGPAVPAPPPAVLLALGRDLAAVRTLCIALIILTAILGGLVYRLSARVESAQRAAEAVPAAISQAADQKLAQLTPQLEQRLGRFEQMSNGLEKRLDSVENDMMSRLRAELPKILDEYAQQKIAQIQREAEKAQASLTRKQ